MDGSKKKIKHSPVHVGVVAVSQLGGGSSCWVKDVGRLVRKINCGVRMQGDYLSLGTKGFGLVIPVHGLLCCSIKPSAGWREVCTTPSL